MAGRANHFHLRRQIKRTTTNQEETCVRLALCNSRTRACACNKQGEEWQCERSVAGLPSFLLVAIRSVGSPPQVPQVLRALRSFFGLPADQRSRGSCLTAVQPRASTRPRPLAPNPTPRGGSLKMSAAWGTGSSGVWGGGFHAEAKGLLLWDGFWKVSGCGEGSGETWAMLLGDAWARFLPRRLLVLAVCDR